MLGSAVIQRLAPSYTLVGFDVVEPDAELPAEHFDVDITSGDSVRGALQQVRERHGDRIASVVHLAAYYDFTGEDSPKYDAITVEGTVRLLRLLRDLKFHVEQFAFSSTMLVHAPARPGEQIDEDSPIQAKWAYPQSKVETEQRIRDEHGDIPVVLLRIAGVYTDTGGQPTLVQQIKRIYERDFESFFFPGDSEAGQSLVHLDDAADALVRTVERRHDLGDGIVSLLIGEPEPPSYAALQDRIGELVWGKDWPTVRVPQAAAKAGAWIEEKISDDGFIKPFMIEMADDHYALDVSRARDRLGWEPQHRVMDTLPKMIADLKRDPKAWHEQNDLEPPEDLEEDAEAHG